MNKHSTITPAVIKHLMTIPAMLEQFPFLRYAARAAKSKEGRSCCGDRRRSGKAPAKVYETVKASMMHLPPDRISLIKKALNADALTISTTVNGKEVVVQR